MNENTTLAPIPDEDEIALVSGTDIKYWQVVQLVAEQFRKGATNTVMACEQAGVARDLYYRALRSQYVQEQSLAQIKSMRSATHAVLERQWLGVVLNMAAIARGDSREAVSAARFLRDVYKDIEQDLDVEERKVGNTGTTAQIQRFLAGKPLVFRKRETIQEVAVEGDVVEGEIVESE